MKIKNMDYEQKYKEALEKARELMDKGYYVLMPEIFSELAESDDERIKREIRNFIWGYPDKLPERDKWLAWLEKQGEQKTKPKFKVGDKVTIEGDNTVYTIDIIDRDESCWLTHEDRGRGWATFGVLKHYVE